MNTTLPPTHTKSSLYDTIVEQVKKIDRSDLSDDVDDKASTVQLEGQKVYIWIRLYIKEELSDLKEGDNFEILYTQSGEKLITKFICFGKKHSIKDADDYTQIQQVTEDDPKILCLMVEEDTIQTGNDIPFIRTLFKISKHFEYQVYKREDLVFSNVRTNQLIDYIDCDF